MRVLFTGYAHVHFVCFRPLFERLACASGVDVFLSGGLREKRGDQYDYDLEAMYRPLGISAQRLLTVEQIADEDFDLLFAANTKLIMPRSVEHQIQIFHGISFRNRAVRSANTTCDHYLAVGPYMRRRFAAAGLFEADDPRVLSIGFMKTDRLLNGQLNRAELLRRHGLTGTRPVILYAPTGQKHNSLETAGEEVLRRLNAANQFDVLIKLHDHPKNRSIDWPERLRPQLNEHCQLVDDLDVIPLLFLADLLISDASSVTNEYALLDRPVVYLDVPRLLERARGKEESMLDLNTWGRRGGYVVERAGDIVPVIEHALSNTTEHSSVRQAMAHDLFYNAGHATDAAASWLDERFGVPVGMTAHASMG